MTVKLAVSDLNALNTSDFASAFGDIAEHSPWVAERAAERRPFASREETIAAFQSAVLSAGVPLQLDLLNAHPDLAGKAAIAGKIGATSQSEQAGAGLDTLTAQEFERFTALNSTYRDTFGFPFILAVRGATKHDILASFETRIDNDRDTEFKTAVQQVCRIIRFRLEDRIAE